MFSKQYLMDQLTSASLQTAMQVALEHLLRAILGI